MHRLFLTAMITGLGLASACFAGGTEVKIGAHKSATPAAWTAKASKITFRMYTFTLPKAEGDDKDAELVVSFTGKASGGDLKPNIERWQGMFFPPKGKTIDEATKIDKMKVGDVEVTTVDIEGTFKDKFPPFSPDAKVTPRPNYRRINAVFASDDGPFFIYLIGPAKTVASHKKSFDDWLKNFK